MLKGLWSRIRGADDAKGTDEEDSSSSLGLQPGTHEPSKDPIIEAQEVQGENARPLGLPERISTAPNPEGSLTHTNPRHTFGNEAKASEALGRSNTNCSTGTAGTLESLPSDLEPPPVQPLCRIATGDPFGDDDTHVESPPYDPLCRYATGDPIEDVEMPKSQVHRDQESAPFEPLCRIATDDETPNSQVDRDEESPPFDPLCRIVTPDPWIAQDQADQDLLEPQKADQQWSQWNQEAYHRYYPPEAYEYPFYPAVDENDETNRASLGSEHGFHEEAGRTGQIWSFVCVPHGQIHSRVLNRIVWKGEEFHNRLSTVTEAEVQQGYQRYMVKFGGKLSAADGIGFVFSSHLPCPKDIKKIVSVFLNIKNGHVKIRQFDKIVDCRTCVPVDEMVFDENDGHPCQFPPDPFKPYGDFIEMCMNLKARTVVFTVWSWHAGAMWNVPPHPMNCKYRTPPIHYGDYFDEAKLVEPLDKGHLACILKNSQSWVMLFS